MIKVIEKKEELAIQLASEIEKRKHIGFVPTMGALHRGHLALVKRARTENDYVVSSIFVNPTQFNDKTDLANYPRNLEADISMLESDHCDLVFTPSVKDMYPDGENAMDVDLNGLDTTMEGAFRPGHFKGMITIVDRLLKSVNPTNAYFGEKDFQQLAIIKYYVKKFDLPYNIIGCETVREDDGLAYSSRNIYLTHEERNAAPLIYKTLLQCTDLKDTKSPKEMQQWFAEQINNTLLLHVQYIAFVNAETLQPLKTWSDSNMQRACVAVTTSKTRLIDNISL